MRSSRLAWRIALVRPRNPLNIGAAARALANFNLVEMAVVAPHTPAWDEAQGAAVGAERVMAAARAFPALPPALADVTLVLGTTTGARRTLACDLIPLPELASWLRARRARGRAALLFGSEKTGLLNHDLSFCHALVRIPTAAGCPSMNLGQAVAVCTYELARAGLIQPGAPHLIPHRSLPASVISLEHLLARASHVLDLAGYFEPKSRAAMLLKLRRFLLSLELTNEQARILGGVLAQIEWKMAHTANAGARTTSPESSL